MKLLSLVNNGNLIKYKNRGLDDVELQDIIADATIQVTEMNDDDVDEPDVDDDVDDDVDNEVVDEPWPSTSSQSVSPQILKTWSFKR